MAFNILGLMHPILFSITQVEPVWGDLSGGFDRIADLADMTGRIRISINEKAELRRAILPVITPLSSRSSMALKPNVFFRPSHYTSCEFPFRIP